MKILNTDTGEFIDFEWRTPYNHDTTAAAQLSGVENKEPSLTQQHQAEEADINTIVRNFGVTGQIPVVPLPPAIDEFADTFDFQSAMNLINEAKHSFSQLNADVREAFRNDPSYFVGTIDSMLNDTDKERREKNLQALRAMGLAVEPGPKADTTTLGDVLAAIKAQAPGEPPGHPKTP